MRILIVGAGSTGGYFGGRLIQAGRDVTFLVRPGRAAQLRDGGLRIVSPHGDAQVTPCLVTADAIDGPYDVVLVTVKAYSLDAALADMAPAVGPNTMILPVLNGMRHVEALVARFGKSAVIGGLCKIIATLDPQGGVVQMTPLHDLSYGEFDGRVSPRIAQLDKVLQGAGVDARLSPCIEREMWEKWTFLATLGGVTCLMRGTIGEIEAAPQGIAFLQAFLDEVVAVVSKAGLAPSEAVVKATHTMLTAKGSALTASMYRDLLAGGQTEADQIIGDLWRRGQAVGLTTPLLAAAWTHLSVYQGRL